MASCMECIHFNPCNSHKKIIIEKPTEGNDWALHNNVENECKHFTPTADVVSVKHGKWHIIPDVPYDESDCPTEEGWYRIITVDGEESTDYFFNDPRVIGNDVVYWKNTKKGIRAWARLEGENNG